MSPARIELLDSPFDRVGMQSTIDHCIAWCYGPRVAHTVITLNAALLCAMRRDAELRAACRSGDLIVADGVPVVWTSRLAGVPLPERVAGVDLTPRLFAEGAARGFSAYLLGGRTQAVDDLVLVGLLRNVAKRARVECADDPVSVREARQHDHVRPGQIGRASCRERV